MPLTKAALEALSKTLPEYFGAVGDCNHCLIWKTENPKSAHYRALKVLADNDDKGTTPQELAQQALLTWRQLDRVLNDFEMGNVALMRHQLWFPRGCTCNLPF